MYSLFAVKVGPRLHVQKPHKALQLADAVLNGRPGEAPFVVAGEGEGRARCGSQLVLDAVRLVENLQE